MIKASTCPAFISAISLDMAAKLLCEVLKFRFHRRLSHHFQDGIEQIDCNLQSQLRHESWTGYSHPPLNSCHDSPKDPEQLLEVERPVFEANFVGNFFRSVSRESTIPLPNHLQNENAFASQSVHWPKPVQS